LIMAILPVKPGQFGHRSAHVVVFARALRGGGVAANGL